MLNFRKEAVFGILNEYFGAIAKSIIFRLKISSIIKDKSATYFLEVSIAIKIWINVVQFNKFKKSAANVWQWVKKQKPNDFLVPKIDGFLLG